MLFMRSIWAPPSQASDRMIMRSLERAHGHKAESFDGRERGDRHLDEGAAFLAISAARRPAQTLGAPFHDAEPSTEPTLAEPLAVVGNGEPHLAADQLQRDGDLLRRGV